jgi:hypothetical protein
MECNRPEQVSFAPGKLRARAPILCPRLGRTYLKQTPLCLMIRENIFVLWPAPEAFFRFSAHFVERDRQPQTSVYPVASPRGLATGYLTDRTDWASSNRRVPRLKFGETARRRRNQLCSIAPQSGTRGLIPAHIGRSGTSAMARDLQTAWA